MQFPSMEARVIEDPIATTFTPSFEPIVSRASYVIVYRPWTIMLASLSNGFVMSEQNEELIMMNIRNVIDSDNVNDLMDNSRSIISDSIVLAYVFHCIILGYISSSRIY